MASMAGLLGQVETNPPRATCRSAAEIGPDGKALNSFCTAIALGVGPMAKSSTWDVTSAGKPKPPCRRRHVNITPTIALATKLRGRAKVASRYYLSLCCVEMLRCRYVVCAKLVRNLCLLTWLCDVKR